MISKREEKLIHSLKIKKYRYKHRLYLAEGPKVVKEIIQSGHAPQKIYCSDESLKKELIQSYNIEKKDTISAIDEKSLKKLSALSTPNKLLAIFPMTSTKQNIDDVNPENWILALDNINDPGNLGTIIRIADWFGIEKIFCSSNCVDVYNPKTIQSTMGSIARIKVIYRDLLELIKKNNSISTYAATLNGKSINKMKPKPGIIIIGNESHGVNAALLNQVDEQITIPKIGNAESLNASIATGIICAQFCTK